MDQRTADRLRSAVHKIERLAPHHEHRPTKWKRPGDWVYVQLTQQLVNNNLARAFVVGASPGTLAEPLATFSVTTEEIVVQGSDGYDGVKWGEGSRGWCLSWGAWWFFLIPDQCGDENVTNDDLTDAETQNEDNIQWLLGEEA